MALESGTVSPELQLGRLRAAYAAGQVEFRALRKRLRAAGFGVARAEVRYRVAKSGLPIWVFALAIGSIGAVVISLAPMAVFNPSPAILLGCVIFGYGVFGGGTASLLWNEVNEPAERRLLLRLARFTSARAELDSVSTEFREMRAKLLVVESSLAGLNSAVAASTRSGVESAAHTFIAEPSPTDAQRDYLLSIDPLPAVPGRIRELHR
jgi:hypothetical protein